MSKETAFQIISIAAILIITAFYTGQYYATTSSKLSSSQSSISGTGSQNAAGTTQLTLSATEIAKHSSSSNCWIIVENKVYDVTNFLGQHSGGASQIIPSCGTDATQIFLTKAGTGTHQTNDIQFLAPMYLGDLSSQITTTSNNSSILNHPVNSNIPPRREDDD